MTFGRYLKCLGLIGLATFHIGVKAAGTQKVNQQVWSEFSASERITVLGQYPDIEVIPTETVGIIHSIQTVNRSTSGTSSGAVLGAVVGQAAYIDNAFKGSGSNYSALSQVGSALLGAAAGSALDTPGQRKFILNYGVRTLAGQIREVRIESADEFAKPVGQCVLIPSMDLAPPSLCVGSKVLFIQQLAASRNAPAPVQVPITPIEIKKNITCRVPNVGLMTLEASACAQVEGVIEI